jgi:hypothetical protein
MRWQGSNSKPSSTKAIRSHVGGRQRPNVGRKNPGMLKIGGLLDLRLGLALVVAVGLALVLVFLGPLSPWSIQAAPAISDAAMHNPSPNSTTQSPITITASADAHGSISPSGTMTVEYGSNQAFAIVPDALCHIEDVLVDSSSVGAVGSYTFTNVTGNHTIRSEERREQWRKPDWSHIRPSLCQKAISSHGHRHLP